MNQVTDNPHAQRELIIWTIYRHPRDYPDKFVARPFAAGSGGALSMLNDLVIADTLDQVRKRLPPGLLRMPRLDDDDPVIVETWM